MLISEYVTTILVVKCWAIFNYMEDCERNSCVHSYQIYKDIWDAVIDEAGTLWQQTIRDAQQIVRVWKFLPFEVSQHDKCDMFLYMCMQATEIEEIVWE